MAKPCRGDCEADCIILLGSIAQRGSAVWVQRHAACPARERSMPAEALRSPPCAKGGQHGKAMQGGLRSRANDSAGCCDRVREHRLAVPTRDREHRLGAEARRQSLSRRSPTAPFAQGSRLCCSAHNHPFLWRWARIAKQPLPGDGLSHPEHRGRAVHKAFSEFWVQRHAGPVPGRPFLSLPDCAQPSLSVALGQDCKAAPTG